MTCGFLLRLNLEKRERPTFDIETARRSRIAVSSDRPVINPS
jgi:hypothetical protein